MSGEPQHDAGPVVEVRSVAKSYRRATEVVAAVRDASLTLRRGSVTVLSGPSGSGKTTLLNLTLGWETPDAGSVTGLPAAPTWSQVAVLPQSLGLLDQLTIGENVALPGRVAATALDPLALMDELGIGHLAERFPGETSLGEQQRAALARALVTHSSLIVADEPTSHQDDASVHRIVDQLVAAAAAGSALLVATHDDRVAAVAHQLLTIDDGVVTPT